MLDCVAELHRMEFGISSPETTRQTCARLWKQDTCRSAWSVATVPEEIVQSCVVAYCGSIDSEMCRVPEADFDLSDNRHAWIPMWRDFNDQVLERDRGFEGGSLSVTLLSLVAKRFEPKNVGEIRVVNVSLQNDMWQLAADFLTEPIQIPRTNTPQDFSTFAQRCSGAGVTTVYIDGDQEIDDPTKTHLVVAIQGVVQFVEFNPKVSR